MGVGEPNRSRWKQAAFLGCGAPAGTQLNCPEPRQMQDLL